MYVFRYISHENVLHFGMYYTSRFVKNENTFPKIIGQINTD